MSHVAGTVMAGQFSSQYCPNCQCGGCVIHRERIERQEQIHRDQNYGKLRTLTEIGDLQVRPGQIFHVPSHGENAHVFGRGLADVFISQQNAMNAAIRNEPHPAVQVDQRSWLERWILPVLGVLFIWLAITIWVPFI